MLGSPLPFRYASTPPVRSHALAGAVGTLFSQRPLLWVTPQPACQTAVCPHVWTFTAAASLSVEATSPSPSTHPGRLACPLCFGFGLFCQLFLFFPAPGPRLVSRGQAHILTLSFLAKSAPSPYLQAQGSHRGLQAPVMTHISTEPVSGLQTHRCLPPRGAAPPSQAE